MVPIYLIYKTEHQLLFLKNSSSGKTEINTKKEVVASLMVGEGRCCVVVWGIFECMIAESAHNTLNIQRLSFS